MNIYLVHSATAIGQHTTAHSSVREARAEARRRDGSWEWAERHDSLSDFVRSHAVLAGDGTRSLLPDVHVPDRLHQRLCRIYGSPSTSDLGTAYWRVPDQEAAS